jgi:CheY-like chemotaxis protein/two-component sensor histidine kinase
MSHDIRTPMNAILGFTNLALDRIDEPERVRDYLGKIKISGNHLLALINDVLDMSRIESGKMKIEETVCNLQEIVEELRSVMTEEARGKQLDFRIQMDAVFNRTILCDKLKINQILINLIGNALKFTPNGGTVLVSICQKMEGAKEGRGIYEFHVKDNGIGMSKEFQKSIFDPFTRERTSTVSRLQGTGLGLSIVKNIVDLMGGSIDLISEEEKGTEVIVTLEFVLKEEVPEKDVQKVKKCDLSALAGKRILLVEDNELNREIAVEILENQGMIVATEENGEKAVERIIKSGPNAYEAILMDIQMPGMDGYEATKAIRKLEDKALADIPIIAMTASAFEEDRKKATEAGMNGYVSKPIDIPVLFETLGSLI